MFSPLAPSLAVPGSCFPNRQVLTPTLACEIPSLGASLIIVDRVLGKVLKKQASSPVNLNPCFLKIN